jgi:hypothetical protein
MSSSVLKAQVNIIKWQLFWYSSKFGKLKYSSQSGILKNCELIEIDADVLRSNVSPVSILGRSYEREIDDSEDKFEAFRVRKKVKDKNVSLYKTSGI